MELGKTTFPARSGFRPNPKLRLREQLREVMRFKQLSLRTEAAYWMWIRQFILFHHKRHPREMGKSEIEAFLSQLTVARKVPVSTQNQALNALVFLYGEVLHQPLGELGEFMRVRRPARVPVVLSLSATSRLSRGGPRSPSRIRTLKAPSR